MSQESVELYVNAEIEKLIDEKVQSLTRVNRRLYKNKLLFIVSRILWKQVHHPGDYNKNGAKLRTHVNADRLKIDLDAVKGTLVWYLSSKGGKVTEMIHTLKAWKIIEPKKEPVIGVSTRTYSITERFSNGHTSRIPFTIKDGPFVKKLLQEDADRANHPLLQSILEIYRNYVSLSEEGLQFIQKLYGKYYVINDIADTHRKDCFDDNRESLLQAYKRLKIAPENRILMKLFVKECYASIGPRNGRVDHSTGKRQNLLYIHFKK